MGTILLCVLVVAIVATDMFVNPKRPFVAPEQPTAMPTSQPAPEPTAAPAPQQEDTYSSEATFSEFNGRNPYLPNPLYPQQNDSLPNPAAQQSAVGDTRPSGKPDYSFFWFTDSQYYSEKYPETFYAMTEWMRNNAALYNVQYVLFTGDFVDNNDETEWAVVNKAMERLDGVVPVFAIAGNHDVGTSAKNYASFSKYFGPDRFKDNPNVAAWYKDGQGRMDLVELAGTKYMFIGLGWGACTSSGLSWMNQQLQAHPDYKAILLFHDYMKSNGLLSDTGEEIYSKVVAENRNVFMVLCGHRYDCALLSIDIDDDGDHNLDRTVYNIIMNYQAFENGGNGYLALLRVYKRQKVITLDTYSPVLDKWYRLDPTRHINKEQLTLPVSIFD